MRILRTLSTPRLIAIVVVVFAVAVGGAVAAVAARGGSSSTPPPEPLAQAIHDALGATQPAGISARISFTNKLFPSGSLIGAASTPLISGAGGRLWVNGNGGRLELQSSDGGSDVQLVWSETKGTLYDASSNTAYTFDLPAKPAGTKSGSVPTLDQITTFLTKLQQHWTVSGAEPTNVGGQQAYTVTVSPSHDGGLLGKAELAWAALNGTPLKVAIYAQGASSPALALEVTSISFSAVPDSDVQWTPPPGAKIVALSSPGGSKGNGTRPAPVTGLAAVQAAAGFPVTAPDTLVGLPLKDVRLVGPADSRSAIAVYGQGLGAIVLVERAKDASGGGNGMSALDSLPTVSIGGATGHELSTQLGTIIGWASGGVQYVLAGSVPAAAAQAAAAAVK